MAYQVATAKVDITPRPAPIPTWADTACREASVWWSATLPTRSPCTPAAS